MYLLQSLSCLLGSVTLRASSQHTLWICGGGGGGGEYAHVHSNRRGFYSCVSCVHVFRRIVNWAIKCTSQITMYFRVRISRRGKVSKQQLSSCLSLAWLYGKT